MISDSIPNASISMASSSNHRYFAKKKKGNRSAKLKQCKLDARREQWLSQVKNKSECKEEVDGRGQSVRIKNERGHPMEKLDTKTSTGKEIYEGDGMTMHHYADFVSSPSTSPNSLTSSILGSNDSGINFTASSRSGSSSGRSSSCSSNGCFSENMSEEDEGDVGDDGCLDDWEAIADALAAEDEKQQEHITNSELDSCLPEQCGKKAESSSQFSGINIPNAKQESGGTTNQNAPVNSRAWWPDDACRPQSLPNLTKQFSLPLNSERHFGCAWGYKNLTPIPTSCPICCEDLDTTDSNFLPCSCGFRLCLFCHKRIIEEDGRCPGCRKQYECDPVKGEAAYDGGSLTFRLARSCSMITRS